MIFKKLYAINDKWHLEYIQDDVTHEEEFDLFEEAKNRCQQLGFNLAWRDTNGN